MDEKIKRWRLILGQDSQQSLGALGADNNVLDPESLLLDQALAEIYDETDGTPGQRGASLGASSPRLTKWLGDIRSFFPEDVVSIIQNDAIERKGLKKLLLEPEVLKNVKPDISMVGTLMALKGQIPEKSKDTARALIRSVVQEIMERLETDMKKAVIGAINRKAHTPIAHFPSMDWKRTIQRNMKHYQLSTKRIIPERFYFFERTNKSKQWNIILDIDQSGSMADSIIYSSVMASIFASMPVLDTKVVAFDTSVVDLTELCQNDPVDLLFGIQLGGGTDINRSVEYCMQLIEEPQKTIFILISDLYEGGVESALLAKMEALKEAGVKVITLLALSDRGKPAYDEQLGKKIVKLGIPAFACSPDRLPELIEGAIKGFDLMALSEKIKS